MELSLSRLFIKIPLDELVDTQGSGDPWSVAAGAFTCVSGVGMIIGGIGLWLVPEPTTLTKFAGTASIVGGTGIIAGGVATIMQNY